MKKIAVPILCILVLAAIPLVGSQAQPDLVISNVWEQNNTIWEPPQ